jgi:hypothetical protein
VSSLLRPLDDNLRELPEVATRAYLGHPLPRSSGRYPVTRQSGNSFYEWVRGRDSSCICESARNLQAKARLYKPMRSTLFCIPSSGLILREVRGLPDRRVNVRSYSEPSGSIHCYAIRAAFCGRIGASDDLRGVA